MITEPFDHEQAAALLPWLANGTLDGDERAQVERHVRHCLTCRAELAEQSKIHLLMQRQPAVPLSADASFARLRARLDGAPRRGSADGRRMTWALAAAAAIAAVGLMLAVSMRDAGSPVQRAEFGTLTQAAGDDALVDVIFAGNVRETALRALLEEIGGEIVAGPSTGLGRYTLRVPAETAAELDHVVQRLLDDERVRFAAPTFAPPP